VSLPNPIKRAYSRITHTEKEYFNYIDKMKEKVRWRNKDFNLVIICGAPASGKMTVGQEGFNMKRRGFREIRDQPTQYASKT